MPVKHWSIEGESARVKLPNPIDMCTNIKNILQNNY